MNEEQNDTENSSETNNTAGTEPVATGSTPGSNNDDANAGDDYYAVDHAKKDVISTIGDGEMHNEGLLGEGEATTTDIQSSTDRLADEQDEAEFHDSEE